LWGKGSELRVLGWGSGGLEEVSAVRAELVADEACERAQRIGMTQADFGRRVSDVGASAVLPDSPMPPEDALIAPCLAPL
jgi:hypothetical protein